MSKPEFDYDLENVRVSFSQAALTYDDAAFLQNEVADRLLGRLDYICLDPDLVLDLGAGTGYCSERLLKKFPSAKVVALDFAEGMLAVVAKRGRILRRPKPVCASARALPFAAEQFELLLSSLMLQWCHPVEEYFREFRRVLKPGGLLMFSTFGPDTLRELRDAWANVDDGVHVHGFMDMHDVGDALLGEGFSDPVMDVERIVLTYDDVISLLKELKAIGANNASSDRAKGLMGRDALRLLSEGYEMFRTMEGVLPATYEVVFGHAWAPEAVKDYKGRSVIPIKSVI